MAIQFARCQFVKRSSGQNACAKAAYTSKSKIYFEGNCISDPQVYDWSYKGEEEHHVIMLPEGADKKFIDPEALWNLAEKAERQKNSQVAMEIVLALPDDACISKQDRIEMAEQFVKKNITDKGLAAQIDIHSPTRLIAFTKDNKELGIKRGEGGVVTKIVDGHYLVTIQKNGKDVKTVFFDPEKHKNFSLKEQNWHAHVLVTTRRFAENGLELARTKARDMLPAVRKGRVVSGPDWGKLWGIYQNQYFKEKGLSLRVDPIGITAQQHLGPVRMRGRAFALMEDNENRKEQNALQSLDPGAILQALTKP